MASLAKWTPRIPILPKNNIISSDFTNTKPFVPAYEKDPEDMQMVMSNSYAKKWHQEKTVFKKLIQDEKIENEVFLMRRYVIKGLNKKLQHIQGLKAVPSRIKVGKKVPYAVRLLPNDKPSKSPSCKNIEELTSSKNKRSEHKLHVSIQEKEKPKICNVVDSDGRLNVTADLGPVKDDLEKLEETCNHVHVEGKGNKFVLHRVKCDEDHHHQCECTDFDHTDEPCFRGSCRD